MAKDPNSSDDQNSSYLNQDDSEKTLVGKFKSIISNTPLSKWFRRQDNDVKSTIRRREEDYEEVNQLQPPTKKAKFAITLEDDVGVLSNKSSDGTNKDKLINRNYSFPEPVAGPSGLQSRNLLNNVNTPINSDINVQLFGSSDFLNGHKDSDSEESTSGYSSVPRIGSKEHVCQSEGSSKQHSPLQIISPNRRSLFGTPAVDISNRTLFTTPQQNTSMSSRRPHFNSSTFGSPNFVDQTLSTEKVIRSPFYSGSTMYGGASAFGNKFGKRAKDLRGSLKKSVQIRPIRKNTESGSMVLGKTARKILETLEQYSTPVNDAKKIPVASKRVRFDTSLLGKHVGVNQYIVPGESAFRKELQVPTVPDLLKMKQKLQSSTEAVRQIATSSKSDLNMVSPKQYISSQDTVITPKLGTINTQEKNVSVHKNQNPILQKEKNITPLRVNKLKEAVSSPPISSLPKFDLIIPPMVKVPEKLVENPVVFSPAKIPNVPQPIVMKNNSQKEQHIIVTHFKFSDPLIISENLKCIVAINNFKFSEPLTNLNKLESKNTSKQFKEKNNGQTIVENTFMDKFKPATGTWECSTCLIRNQKEKTKCVACETPKLNPVQTENKKVSSFGEKFKMPDNMWECSVCMIRNSNDRTKCLACETPNPKSSTLVSSSSGFQAKFKPPANTWECSTCLIRNKNEIEKCAACETPRVAKNPPINDLATAFKKKADEWECSVCMVKNHDTHMKCQCCEAAKPGSTELIVQETEKKPQPKFNFGIDKASVAQFKFGIQPTSTSEVSVTKLQDPITTTSTVPTLTSSIQKNVDTSKTSITDVKSAVSSSTVKKPKATTEVPQIVRSPNNKCATSATAVAKPTFSFGLEKPKSAETVVATKTAVSDKAPETAKPTTTSTFKFGNTSKPVIPPKATFEQTKTTVVSEDNGLDPKASPTFATTCKQSSEVPLINKTAAKPFLFESTDSNGNTPVKVPTFNFGQTMSPSSKPPTTQSSGFGFEHNTSKITQSFDFGLKTNPTMTQSSGFNSGQNAATMPQSSGFNFGPTPAVNLAATQSTGFNNQPVTKSLSFNFSVAKTESGNIFSGAASGTASKNGIFNFGAANQGSSTTQKTGFNFGGAANAPVPPFNVGATTTTTQAAPSAGAGFSFTMPYDANAKPTFNFTDGPVAFSSQPSGEGGAAIPRKIRKAVRRTQR